MDEMIKIDSIFTDTNRDLSSEAIPNDIPRISHRTNIIQ